ncbi:hypothetical protein HZS_7218 [Henneguya salminicola]|nr:hypothetical protein HZS_7218 [Henneguya salminicola]
MLSLFSKPGNGYVSNSFKTKAKPWEWVICNDWMIILRYFGLTEFFNRMQFIQFNTTFGYISIIIKNTSLICNMHNINETTFKGKT